MAAAPGPPAKEITFADLQKKVEQTGGPAGAPKHFVDEWLRFVDAPIPSFEFSAAGGLWLKGASTASQKDAYAGFFGAVYEAAMGRMKLKCKLGGCTAKPISYHVLDSLGKDTYPFSNAFTHLETCGGPRVLRRDDALSLIQRSGKKGAQAAAGDGASSAGGAASAPAKRERDESASVVESHLAHLGMSELAVVQCACCCSLLIFVSLLAQTRTLSDSCYFVASSLTQSLWVRRRTSA